MSEITIVDDCSLFSIHSRQFEAYQSTQPGSPSRNNTNVLPSIPTKKLNVYLESIFTLLPFTIKNIIKIRNSSPKSLPLPSAFQELGFRYLCPCGRSIFQCLMTNWNRSRFLHRIRNIARLRCPLKSTPLPLPRNKTNNKTFLPAQNWPTQDHHK